MISKKTIDQVFQTARVEEVVGDFVTLKKSGSNFKGLSPFSQERTPSFMVSPVKQIWKDFSSGKGGNIVAFLMEHEHFSYPEAIKYLAKKYNIEVEETATNDAEKEKRNHLESLYLVNQFAQENFSKNLWESSEGKSIGLSYYKERGFEEKTIHFFGLGYSLKKYDNLYNESLATGHNEQYLLETGLIIKNDKGYIDRFRGRIIFPIKSMAGRILGFGARTLVSDTKAAKYLNSPESNAYSKGEVLYGLYEAKKAIVREDSCYLVEGYTDVIQMYQKGIENVVSSSGTALTLNQIRLIRRLTSNIIILFDGDLAGQRAAIRGIDLNLQEGMNVKVSFFPNEEDPDSFDKSNELEKVRAYLSKQSNDFIQFKIDFLLKESEGDPIKKAETIRNIISSISKIPDAIKREIYIKECAVAMEVSEQVLFDALAQEKNKKNELIKSEMTIPKAKKGTSGIEKIKKPSSYNPILNLEKQILSILIHYGGHEAYFDEVLIFNDSEGNLVEESKIVKSKVYEKVFLDLQQDEIEMIKPEYQTLYTQIIESYQREGKIRTEKIIQQKDNNTVNILTDIMLSDEEHRLHAWEKKNIFVKDRKSVVGQLVNETILTFRRHLVDQKIQNIVKTAETQEDNYDHLVFLEEVIQYQSLKKLLSRKLNRVL